MKIRCFVDEVGCLMGTAPLIKYQ